MKCATIILAGIAAVTLSGTAFAHHSFARFDSDTIVEIEGTVKELRWTNPHAWLFMVVTDAGGQATEWSFEMTSPAGLARNGWRPDTVTSGDKITVRAHPMRDGSSVGQFQSATLPDGQILR